MANPVSENVATLSLASTAPTAIVFEMHPGQLTAPGTQPCMLLLPADATTVMPAATALFTAAVSVGISPSQFACVDPVENPPILRFMTRALDATAQSIPAVAVIE